MPELSQREIARLASVSQATVSRVLNNDPRVNEGARERVLAAVKAHDYVPNARAQSLRSQHTGTLGLVVNRSSEQLAGDPFFSRLIVAMLQAATANGYNLCVDTARKTGTHRTVDEELLRTRRVDGVVLVEPRNLDERIDRLKRGGFAFVLIGRYRHDESICSVDNDNVHAGRQVAEMLLSGGRRRIAYIGGPEGVNVSEDRLAGYRQALAAAGLEADPFLVRRGDFSEQGGFEAMCGLMLGSRQPDAVIGVDDLTAAGALRAARASGARVPDEMAFVGFNDSAFCPHTNPPLASVSIGVEELGRTAAETLINLVEGTEVAAGRRIVPTRLVNRASSGLPDGA